jgi:chromosome segregation ATPase
MMCRELNLEEEGKKMSPCESLVNEMIGMLLPPLERMTLQLAIFPDLVSAREVQNIILLVLPPYDEIDKGTDFSSVKDTDWEKVRLQRELATLNEKIESAEAEARSRRLGKGKNSTSKSGLVKRELEQMLDFKRRELRRLKDGEDIEKGGSLERVRNEVQSFKEQVDALATHLARREEELRNLQRSIETV